MSNQIKNPMYSGCWPYDTPRKGEGPRTHHLADIEDGYIRTEREGIVDEAYWAAVNGTDFEVEQE